ncbi:hypothetical protein [Hydrogenophaga sp.]|uniref:hypothetical protein n=1 Tax=Hydrogenophaga sp. TaxID=1904254 RepID=UPI0026348B13|nr:hypothetical protein [Hydrogenophaga sp.]MDM7950089.1 hypothetical protein [Hydrogenophaga sp.]
MSGAQSAESALIVIKRLGKWAAWCFAGLVLLACLFVAGVWVNQYIENRPYQANRYADLDLGDEKQEVLYASGPPTHYALPPPPTLPTAAPPAPWEEDQIVWEVGKSGIPSDTYEQSSLWFYVLGDRRIDVYFDKPGGRVSAIGCFSKSSFLCPTIFGIRDGSKEEDVLSHLGPPASEQLHDMTKSLRYPQYNLTLLLEKRRVYLLKVSAGAATTAQKESQ